MKIAVMTGGGDVPGLNPCIKAIVDRCDEEGHESFGILHGWGGLLYYNPDEPTMLNQHFVPLTRNTVRTIDRTGGTILHTSRTHPGKVPYPLIPDFLRSSDQMDRNKTYDFTPHVLRVLKSLGIDVLIVIGGDDTLSYGARIHEEGFPVICIPKTMDNDVTGTDYCIGFSTAITESVAAITKLRTTTGSHERFAVIELFGRYSGETSLISAYLGSADRAIISEVPFDVEHLAELLSKDKHDNPSQYAMVTISEGAREVQGSIIQKEKIGIDPYGHKKLGGVGAITAAKLEQITGEKTVFVQLSFLMRSGPPDTLDKMVGFNFGNLAMDLIHENGGHPTGPLHACFGQPSFGRTTQGGRRRPVRHRELPAES
jgi:6-phosphofructokinase